MAGGTSLYMSGTTVLADRNDRSRIKHLISCMESVK